MVADGTSARPGQVGEAELKDLFWCGDLPVSSLICGFPPPQKKMHCFRAHVHSVNSRCRGCGFTKLKQPSPQPLTRLERAKRARVAAQAVGHQHQPGGAFSAIATGRTSWRNSYLPVTLRRVRSSQKAGGGWLNGLLPISTIWTVATSRGTSTGSVRC